MTPAVDMVILDMRTDRKTLMELIALKTKHLKSAKDKYFRGLLEGQILAFHNSLNMVTENLKNVEKRYEEEQEE